MTRVAWSPSRLRLGPACCNLCIHQIADRRIREKVGKCVSHGFDQQHFRALGHRFVSNDQKLIMDLTNESRPLTQMLGEQGVGLGYGHLCDLRSAALDRQVESKIAAKFAVRLPSEAVNASRGCLHKAG